MKSKLEKIDRQISRIKISQRSQHRIIKEVLHDILEIIVDLSDQNIKVTAISNNLEEDSLIDKDEIVIT